MSKRSRKYREAVKMLDRNKLYSPQEAAELVSKVSYTSFVSSIDIAINTQANPKYNDQNLRATLSLPHGNGKQVKVAAFVSDDKRAELTKAGADIVWNEDLLEKIEKGEIDFDILVTTPDRMRDLAKVAKTLGPKGLMPNPKAGTVAADLVSAVSEIKKGRFEYKLDKTGNIHAIIGRTDFDPAHIAENIQAFVESVNSHKPAGVKGKLINSVSISPSMGPSISIEI